VINEVRHRVIRHKHNVLLEEPLHDSTIPAPQAPQGHDPTPSQVAVARERWQRLMAGRPPLHQKIIALRYTGETYRQIAEKVGMHERTVRKIVEQIMAPR
jgi:DNA-directed RNA polymerase specialized sigma24 family protein